MSGLPRSTSFRSPIVFAIGLCCAAGLAVSLDSGGRYLALSGSAEIEVTEGELLEVRAPRPLSDADLSAARIAWKYFENNTDPDTGLVSSVAGFPSTTLWDQGSYLLGLMAARRLEVVSQSEFDERVSKLLASFDNLPLFGGSLPNKAYNTQTLAMTDYGNVELDIGLGWSAIDVARMLTAFRVLERHAPQYGDDIRNVLAGWDLDAMAQEGEMIGAAVEGAEVVYPQEGRIGYEQYGARAAAMWGLDVGHAISASRSLAWTTVQGVEIPTDLRRFDPFGGIVATLSEPYILQGLEFGLDFESHIFASRIYRAQEARYLSEGRLTMVSEDHIDRAPHFLYSSVHGNGEDWSVLTDTGEHHPDLRTLSVKATFAWDALFGTDYTELARSSVLELASEEAGWAAGRYEETGEPNEIYTLNTNAVVLEAIHHMAHGPLWQVRD